MKLEFGFIFTHLLAAAGVGYGWLNPLFGLMVYWAFAILRPTSLWFWNWGKWATERFSFYVALATLVGWLIMGLGNWSGFRYVRWPILGLMVYLACGAMTTLLVAPQPELCWTFLYPQLTIGLMALVTLSLVRGQRNVQIFAWIVILSLGYLAYNFNYQYRFQSQTYLYFNGFGGIDNNGVAMIMVMGVPLAFFLGINARPWWIVPAWAARLLCFFIVACLVHVVLFSFSRGAQLGLIIVGGMIFTLSLASLPNKVLTLAAGLGAVAFALYFAGEEVRQEFWTIFMDPATRDASANSRWDTWVAGARCMMDHPLGVGPRMFNFHYAYHYLPQYGHAKSVHNLFLQTGADYGVLGALGLTLFYVGTMWQTFKMVFSRTARRLVWPAYYGQMVCVSLAGFCICSIFIGMESVEVGYIVALVGLVTVQHVRTVAAVEPNLVEGPLPELEQVLPEGEFEPLHQPQPA